jgi:hypothetical protein
MLPPALGQLEARVDAVRQKYPDEPLIVIGDNFHLYAPTTKAEGEERIRAGARCCRGLVADYRCTVIMTMELPKNALGPGMRPSMLNLKGSAGLSYDSSANIGVYNDIKDLRDAAVLVWETTSPELVRRAWQLKLSAGIRKKPVIELVFDKKQDQCASPELYYQFLRALFCGGSRRNRQVHECSAGSTEEKASFANTEAGSSQHNAHAEEYCNGYRKMVCCGQLPRTRWLQELRGCNGETRRSFEEKNCRRCWGCHSGPGAGRKRR